MILLASTSDKLQLITASAVADCKVHVSWIDNNNGSITPGRTNSSIASATTTDIVASPGASTYRNIKTINIRNTHASDANTITLNHTDGTTVVELFKCQLAAGEVLSYVEGMGWDIYAADGSHKAQGARLLFKVLAADDSGGLAATGVQPWFPSAGALTIDANTLYAFEGLLSMTTGTSSTILSTAFGGTATVSSILYEAIHASAAANTHNTPTANVISQVNATAVGATGTGVNKRISVQGHVRFGAGGTFIPQFSFSVNPTGTITIKANSFFRLWPLGDTNVTAIGTWS